MHLKKVFLLSLFVFITASICLAQPTPDTTKAQNTPQHFIYFGADREKIHDPLFLDCKKTAGAQLRYTWRSLEPGKNEYDFSEIKEDLAFLQSQGKKLFIQLVDATFSQKWIAVPAYLTKDSIYHGGAFREYEYRENDTIAMDAGWGARRWDPAVRERFQKLFQALANEFDGKIAGINLQETSLSIGQGTLRPEGFTPKKYRDGILDNMKALKKAFQKSDCIQYANFMPGGYNPGGDTTLLPSVYEFAKNNKIGIGGPDILVYKPGQMRNSYGLIRDCAGIIITGVAVQDGNYDHINPQTGKQVTVKEIYEFARDYLKLKYIFWCNEEPYYSQTVIPYLMNLSE